MGYHIENGLLTMENGHFLRTISLPGTDRNTYLLRSYQPDTDSFGFFEAESEEFSFLLNGISYTGHSGWCLEGIVPASDSREGQGLTVTLQSTTARIQVSVTYLWYPGLPILRKRLEVTNQCEEELCLESVDVEAFSIQEYFPPTMSHIYSDYGRKKSIGPYLGTLQDSLILVHHPEWQAGLVLGNEAPGVLKGASVWSRGRRITLGLTHRDEDFPFRKYLAPGETFTAPDVFTGVYRNQPDTAYVLNHMVADYVRKHMGIRLSQIQERPTFVYNTWEPFGFNLTEKLVMESAKAAAEAGITEYVIDDGWDDCYGDWGVDFAKFPNGLKPVTDYIKSLGMKAGIWVSIGTAAPQSKVYKAHPEWFFKGQNGKNFSLVIDDGFAKCTACFSTGWADYILNVLERLVDEYGFDYLKLDFSVVSSPYRYTKEEAGCYAKDHPHRDRFESMWINYNRMWQVFDKLHQGRDNLFIDCTFETMGGLQLVDYAMLRHAEGDWLSNFKGDLGEQTDLRIRQMAWWRSPAVPATSLVIGNAQMQDLGFENHIRSLSGALPIFCGDPRQLPEEKREVMQQYSRWLQTMEQRHSIMLYRQDLPGYFEPALGGFDGFSRINTDTHSGGIVGFFRHGSKESTRTLFVDHLLPSATYTLYQTDGTPLAAMSGAEWVSQGFPITIPEFYGGRLFEIRKHAK